MRMDTTTRRQFARTAGAAVAAAAGASAAAGRPKVGCLSWCFHDFHPGTLPGESIDIIGGMGFEGIELIINAKEDIAACWTDPAVEGIRKQLARHRLAVSQFVLFYPVVEGLTSPDRDERNRNLDAFEAGCRIGSRLNAPMMNIVAPWARELKGPFNYLPRYYEIKEPKPGQKFHIDIAPGFDYERVWEDFTAAVKACLERARHYRMRLSIEHHTHTMVPDADAFLRLWNAVRDPMLGYNLDIGWTLSQREYPPVAIHKVKRHLMNLHARDIDGMMRMFPYVGEGVMDFQAVAAALKAVGFNGFISLEQDKNPNKDMVANCKRYLAMMKEYLA